MVTNNDFLTAIFGEDAPWTHVTDFPYDPVNIPSDKHLAAWKGDYYCRYKLTPGYNQYFTISHFYADDTGQARRRKALYRHTRVIVLDDVKEKLSMEQVGKLPQPAWVLETSPGSEQWGYILDKPCINRAMVENLLDGLVANGLAPDGKDPGMKGVTRYVRLPEGANSKASKMVNGQPYPCRMLVWQPFNRVTIEQLAYPFMVDLNAVRRESRIDGAADIEDHPILQIPNILTIKEVRSDGRFDVVCPWVNEHTNADDSGAAIFTNADGSIGFKCHHGSCQGKTGRDLLHYIDGEQPGFSANLRNWQILRDFQSVVQPASPEPKKEEVDFFNVPVQTTPASAPVAEPLDAIKLLFDQLARINPKSVEARQLIEAILKHTDSLPKLEQIDYHQRVIDAMDWNKGEFKEIIKDLRRQWYGERVSTAEFYDNVVYVKELNQFYDFKSRIFFTSDAFQNSFGHIDTEAKKIALQDGRVVKVDRLDYAPKSPRVFEERGIIYGNTWCESRQVQGVQGDISRWFDHFDVLGWSDYRDHIIKWMAFTIRHPEIKINHMLLLGSGEGCGKDFLLHPLIEAMGEDCSVISGEELTSDFNDHLLSTKYLHINETELGDRREALVVSNKLKPLAAAPPTTLRVNQKGIKPVKIRNIINSTMTTNSTLPLRLNGTSRRFFGVWSDFNPRDEYDNMMPQWLEYWEDRWNWMHGKRNYAGYVPGWQNVVHYLLNEVDLTNFNPGEAPPMTEFLRDIKEASKSPMIQTIDTFIQKQHGMFKCDIMSSSDMVEVLKAGAAFSPGDVYVDTKYITPIRIGMAMKESNAYKQRKAYNLGSHHRVWVLRNFTKYDTMDGGALYEEYQRQLKKYRGEANIQVVQ